MSQKLRKLLIIFLFIQNTGALAAGTIQGETVDSKLTSNTQDNSQNKNILRINLDEKAMEGKTSIIINIPIPKKLRVPQKKYVLKNEYSLSGSGTNNKDCSPIIIQDKAQEKITSGGFVYETSLEKAPSEADYSKDSQNLKGVRFKFKNDLYQPRVDTYYRQGSNQRSLGRVDLFVPIAQNKKSLVFFDMITMKDNSNFKEGNFGLGYRTIFNNDFILGYYGFYDHKISKNNNVMKQITLGTELLTENLDLRANLYLPKERLQKTPYLADGEAIEIRSNGLYASSGSFEGAMMGYDLEFGFRIPHPLLRKFKLTNGYSHFQNNSLSENLDRFNSRVEFDLINNNNHKLIVDGEYFYQTDKNNSMGNKFDKNTYYGGLRYSYTFNGQKILDLDSLQKRMNDRIVRDIDIVSVNKSIGERKIADIYTVGDGSNGEQYNDLQSAYNAINPNSANPIILVSPGKTYTGNFEVINKNNLKVVGLAQDANFKVGSTNKDICSIAKCSLSKANINLGKDDKILIENSNQFEMAGFKIISNGDKLIEANNVNNFYIHNNNLSATSTAIEINQNNNQDSQLTIANNQFMPSDLEAMLTPLTVNFNGSSSNNIININENSISAQGNGALISVANGENGNWGNLTLNVKNNDFDLTKNGSSYPVTNDYAVSNSGNIVINNNRLLPNQKVKIDYYYNNIRSNESYNLTSQYHDDLKQNSLFGIISSVKSLETQEQETDKKPYYEINGLKTNNIYYGNNASKKLDMSGMNSDNISHYYRTSFKLNYNEDQISQEISYKENHPTISPYEGGNIFYKFNRVKLNQ